ncbi:sirohydrochlorin chelatase [Brevibacillus ginsengisoli]|uniref:sirohydrochlorin chelatase n=1 Tax=Brevibacillus ginsengisoli TaxID=363854 RepID=UPI003CF6191E
MEAILFVGHGSKDPEGNQEVIQFIDTLAPQIDVPIIETCFLEFEQPTVTQGLQTCIQKGATRIVVIPLMLFAAGHAKLHIPHEIDEMKELYPHVTFTYGKPVGIHPNMVELLGERFQEAVHSGKHDALHVDQQTAVLLVGRGSSDIDANSDIYKMSRLFWEKHKSTIVETAFMGVTSPTVEEGIDRCIRLGAKQVVILPYLLFTGVLMKRLQTFTQRLGQQYSEIGFVLGHYFGAHRYLQQVVLERVKEAFDGEVKMSCDLCVYRIEAMEHHHHHHHHHDHDHDHDHHHGHAHEHEHDHHHDHGHLHDQENGHAHHHDHDHRHGHSHAHDHTHQPNVKVPQGGTR